VLGATHDFDAAACTRSFTLASADNIGILPNIASRFAHALPRASLRVVTLDHAVASDGLASGDVDVLLGLPPTISREIRSEPAYSDRLVCAMWRGVGPPGPARPPRGRPAARPAGGGAPGAGAAVDCGGGC